MTLFRSFIRAVSNLNVYSRTNEEPARSPSERLRSTISLTNNYISETHGNTGMFATLFFGILDTTTGVMTYINGGHLPPILFNKSGIKHVFSLTGPGVGAISDADYSIREVSLEREDMFFACTDGLTEIEGAVSDFSYEKIIRTLSLQEISLDNSLSKIQVFYGFQASSMQQMDDCTMLACRRL
jgi:sigma-B regulation protein RsbU (phosphoserine phosphatase)